MDIITELNELKNELNETKNLLREINKNKTEIEDKIGKTIDKLKVFKHPLKEIKFKSEFSGYSNINIILNINFHDGYKINIYKTGHNYMEIVSNLIPLLDWIKENPYTIASLEFLFKYPERESSSGFGGYGDEKTILDLKYKFEILYQDLNNINKLLDIINNIKITRY